MRCAPCCEPVYAQTAGKTLHIYCKCELFALSFRHSPYGLAVMPSLNTLALVVIASVATDAQSAQRTNTLDQITVVATKTVRPLKTTPGTITVKTREQLHRELAQNIKDAVRYEPGVSVGNQPSRFGLAGFSIRGLDGNRVLIEVDGARVSDSFSIGSFSNAGRDAVELNMLKRVEIVRGSASSLYGSSAMGGVVAYTTQDVGDYLNEQKSIAGGVRAGFSGENQARFASSTMAVGSPELGALISYSARDYDAYETQGENGSNGAARDQANPQDSNRKAVLAKVGGRISENQLLTLTLDGSRGNTDTHVLSSLTQTPSGSSIIRTTQMLGDDQSERGRAALDWQVQTARGFADTISLKGYSQRSETLQNTFEARTTTTAAGVATPAERSRHFSFDQDLHGGELRAVKNFGSGKFTQRFTYGLSYMKTRTEQMRGGSTRNPITGVVSATISPDVFPVRDFPNSDTKETSAYAQAELQFHQLTVIPGVRIDRYRLTPDPDPIFNADNPGIVTAPLSESATSPKLGLVYGLSPALSLHGQYSEGFRAPPFNDVNIGFTNLQFGYTAIPNAKLKSESSRSFELGVRGSGPLGYFDLTAFRNSYKDFIESLVLVRIDPSTGLSIFQSQNLSEVRIRGVELRGELFLGELTPALEYFSLRGAASQVHGVDTGRNVPLNAIDPRRAVLGLRYQRERLGWELIGAAAGRKGQLDQSAGALYRTSGYGTLDLLVQWQFSKAVRLDLAAFNLTDRTYFDWADVRGRPANDAGILRYSRPGRAFSAALNLDW